MAHHTAWIEAHAADYAETQARRAKAVRAVEIAELRAGYTDFVANFAGAADRLYIDAAFIALEHLEGDAYDIAFAGLDEKIDALDRAADPERAVFLRNPVIAAFDGWIEAQAFARKVAA
jgi:hypothetical protein